MAPETELEEREGLGLEVRLSTSMKDEKRSSSEGRSSEEGGAPEEERGSMNINIDMSSERDRRWNEEGGIGSAFGIGSESFGGGGFDFSIGLDLKSEKRMNACSEL